MKTITVLNDNRTIADKIEEIEKKGWKYVKCEDVHDEHDIPYGDRMLLASKAKLYFEQEQEMQALDAKLDPDGLDREGQQAWNAYEQGIEPVGLDYYVFDLKQGEKVIDQMTFKCSSEQEAYLRAEEAMVDGQECELAEIEPAI